MANGSFGGLPKVLSERLGTFSLLKQHFSTFWKDRNKTDQKTQNLPHNTCKHVPPRTCLEARWIKLAQTAPALLNDRSLRQQLLQDPSHNVENIISKIKNYEAATKTAEKGSSGTANSVQSNKAKQNQNCSSCTLKGHKKDSCPWRNKTMTYALRKATALHHVPSSKNSRRLQKLRTNQTRIRATNPTGKETRRKDQPTWSLAQQRSNPKLNQRTFPRSSRWIGTSW